MEPTEDFDEQWTEAARNQFADAANAVIDAIRSHADTLLAIGGRADTALFAANTSLAAAATQYAEAQLNLTGTGWPFGAIEVDDQPEDDIDDQPEPVARISVLHRADYAVTDEAQLLLAGREAHMEVWPSQRPEDAAAAVPHIGSALYELTHAGGLTRLNATRCLTPHGTTTRFLKASGFLDERDVEQIMEQDPFAFDPDNPPTVLYQTDEI